MKHYIEIVRYEDGEVVNRIECANERKADRADEGLNRQLNHEKYYTRIVPQSAQERFDELSEQLAENHANLAPTSEG